MKVNAVQTTLLKLEVKADSIVFLRNVAKGSLDYVRLTNSNFEALSDHTTL